MSEGQPPGRKRRSPTSDRSLGKTNCQAVNSGVTRFVFDDPATPDEPHGASKRAVEFIGETLAVGEQWSLLGKRCAQLRDFHAVPPS